MSGGSGEQRLRGGRRRRILLVAVVGALIAALAARLWFFEEPPQRLDLQVPDNTTFHYARFVEFQDETGSGAVWYRSAIPAESGWRLIDLVQQSEQEEYGTWTVRFDWPPFRAEYEPIPHRASFSLAASPFELYFKDESTFIKSNDGLYTVPEENRAELRALLDALDAHCQAEFELEVEEAATARRRAATKD